jgi:ribonuclease HII
MGAREERLLEKLEEMTAVEKSHWASGQKYVAGMDEAGRGPLAGPVVVACVIMPEDKLVPGVDDSKKLSEKRREALYDVIIKSCLCYSVCSVDEREIDRINILNATKKAFYGALDSMSIEPDCVYTDAMPLDISTPCHPVIKGDSKIYSIAAASIIAKVTRDAIMRKYDEQYPEYRFAKHKGYGTKEHYEAIYKYGILDIHRKTFLKKLVGDP